MPPESKGFVGFGAIIAVLCIPDNPFRFIYICLPRYLMLSTYPSGCTNFIFS